jgi:thioredoxin 1
MMADNIGNVTDKDFEEIVLKAEKPVLVDFWAVWCGPCKMIVPSIEALAQTYQEEIKVVKLNVDENMQAASKYGVMSIPTLLLFKDGEVKETIVGALPKDKIEEKVKKHL